jgi:rubrerythrin
MPNPITAEKILAVAIDLEKTGQMFYETLAGCCADAQVAALCSRLAKQEIAHAALFGKVRAELPRNDQAAPLTEEQAEQFHSRLKDSAIPHPEKVRQIALSGNTQEALDAAIGMEQGSIRFYADILRSVAPDQAPVVEKIIAEERRHVEILTAYRQGRSAA